MSEILVNTIKKADGTGSITVPAETGTVVTTVSPSLGRRNLIINGAMQVAQRGTSETGITSGGYKTVDRFDIKLSSAGTWTQSQSTTVPSGEGFSYSLKMDCTTADASLSSTDRLLIRHKIEGQDLQQLRFGTSSAKSVTLSFWVRSNKTGTYTLTLQVTDPDSNTRQIAKTYSIATADTWEKKTLTFSGDTGDTIINSTATGLLIQFILAAGSSFTSGTLASDWEAYVAANRVDSNQVNLADSTDNEWYLTGVQLEVGDTATPFEHRSYAEEYLACTRYCFQVTGEGSGGFVGVGHASRAGSATSGVCVTSLPTPMRAKPTVSIGTNVFADYGSSSTTLTATSTVYASASNTPTVWWKFTHGSVSESGGTGGVLYTNDASASFVKFDAEL